MDHDNGYDAMKIVKRPVVACHWRAHPLHAHDHDDEHDEDEHDDDAEDEHIKITCGGLSLASSSSPRT